jgi:purine-binding chemotaxis protein CheW
MTLNNVMDLVNLNAVNEEEVQQVVFWIEEEEFSVDITDIQEIIKYTAPVKVPKSPDYIIGIINFRGHVIPVIDLRIIFNFPKIEINNYPIIVVVEGEEKIFGLLVDKVTDIVTLTGASSKFQ